MAERCEWCGEIGSCGMVKYGGRTKGCFRRSDGRLRSRIAKLEAVVAAAAPMVAAMRRTVALGTGLGLEWANEEQIGLAAYDAAVAELERVQGGEGICSRCGCEYVPDRLCPGSNYTLMCRDPGPLPGSKEEK